MLNIILISKKNGSSRSFELNRNLIIAAFSLLVVVPLTGVGLGYWLGDSDRVDFLTASIQSDVLAQREELEHMRMHSGDEVKAFTRRIAELQARLLRLDALGERLVDVAKLNKDEFNFSLKPAVGGPGEFEESDLGEAMSPPSFVSVIDQLLVDIEQRENQLRVLETLIQNRKLRSESFIAGRPVESGWLSSHYGKRTDPFSGRLAMHKGVDFAGKENSNIISVASGVVTWASSRYGYGILVEVNHGDGFVTRYAHSKEALVGVGDVVQKGEVIARMGSTGRSTGPHVHFEVLKDGKTVDPTRYVLREQKKLG